MRDLRTLLDDAEAAWEDAYEHLHAFLDTGEKSDANYDWSFGHCQALLALYRGTTRLLIGAQVMLLTASEGGHRHEPVTSRLEEQIDRQAARIAELSAPCTMCEALQAEHDRLMAEQKRSFDAVCARLREERFNLQVQSGTLVLERDDLRAENGRLAVAVVDALRERDDLQEWIALRETADAEIAAFDELQAGDEKIESNPVDEQPEEALNNPQKESFTRGPSARPSAQGAEHGGAAPEIQPPAPAGRAGASEGDEPGGAREVESEGTVRPAKSNLRSVKSLAERIDWDSDRVQRAIRMLDKGDTPNEIQQALHFSFTQIKAICLRLAELPDIAEAHPESASPAGTVVAGDDPVPERAPHVAQAVPAVVVEVQQPPTPTGPVNRADLERRIGTIVWAGWIPTPATARKYIVGRLAGHTGQNLMRFAEVNGPMLGHCQRKLDPIVKIIGSLVRPEAAEVAIQIVEAQCAGGVIPV